MEDIRREREAYRQAIDVALAGIQRTNLLIPINQLPPELLIRIFSYYISAPRERLRISGAPGFCDWIGIAHVCHHWRVIALDTPMFWSRILLSAPEWVEEFLRRSKHHPLTIISGRSPKMYRRRTSGLWQYPRERWVFLPSQIVTSLRLVFAQLWRVEVLSLRLPPHLIERIFDAYKNKPFVGSALREASFVNPDQKGIMDLLISHDSSQSLFEIPNLKCLSIRRCRISPNLTFVRDTLTSLTLVRTAMYGAANEPSLKILLSLLSRLALLESLDLHNTPNNIQDDPLLQVHDSNIDLPKVSLPRLKCFHLMHYVPMCGAPLLQHLDFPSRTRIFLKLNVSVFSHSKVVEAVLAAMQRALGGVHDSLTDLAIEFSHGSLDDDIGIEGLKSDSAPCSSEPWTRNETYPSFRLGFVNFPNDVNVMDVIHICLDNVLLYNVRKLLIAHSPWFADNNMPKETTFVTTLLKRCSPNGLDVLCLYGALLNVLPELLSNYSWPDNQPLLYHVKTLELRRFGQYTYKEFKGGLYNAVLSHRMKANTSGCTASAFSSLVLRECQELRRKEVVDIVSAVAEVCSQPGRFDTLDDDIRATEVFPKGRWPEDPEHIKVMNLGEDCDLDYPNWAVRAKRKVAKVNALQHDWVAEVQKGNKVTFDFHGSTGVTVEENIAPVYYDRIPKDDFELESDPDDSEAPVGYFR
ncbi:unnamed protein product [Somion occarium]|uniref:F-box domain-containing protein n=1 Tax=Somion occarium TaxID=3059160 RepID=A0ABP1E816_9APHY